METLPARDRENHIDQTDVTQIILESISDGVFTVDLDWRITSFNRAAEKITGIPRKKAIGRFCWEVFRSDMCKSDCALKRTMAQGKDVINSSTHILDNRNRQRSITVSTSLLKNAEGEVVGGVETFRDHTLVEELRNKISGKFHRNDMVSSSPAMQQIFKILPQIAQSDSTVLIKGETGTGKELMARAIHNLSARAAKPLVSINCGALPDSLLESELFGYKAGAFTSAVKDKPGLFSAAKGGSILLDEISETSPAFQVKLLRVVEAHLFQPLGAVKTEPMDVRIIAATNKNLVELVKTGDFREDLFYRINVIQIELPPLRDRMEDIPLLVAHFITRLNTLRGKEIQGVDPRVMEILMNHNFPGNIRELENIIEHASVLCSSGMITADRLPLSLVKENFSRAFPPKDRLKSAEKELILDALRQNNYNRTAAAKMLGMHKSTFFRRINRLNIILPAKDGRTRKT
ncbi:sigma-54 dependent transcriptional regulator (PAS domain protein) [Desulforapulum autotrophicum HRM2]|uniref:Sigma-54 dependent transcriptional regulator (PAS domain protein) n=1 Tax=Desulforapulum autotrophicum (strain ATCC 43914 / DSM 3382 / VKM B-1955 / HRM2) TaxID=177437 RepID=C0QH85_DESAH|nr:sigma-54-dependent Fis family transcriptional regulator [Desulforapulum autotrophicum]ACN17744.1 sigma-54 dependent transcriptional regulator (PAS domain protein) [Desulforapulum autotrophicum HRM2]